MCNSAGSPTGQPYGAIHIIPTYNSPGLTTLMPCKRSHAISLCSDRGFASKMPIWVPKCATLVIFSFDLQRMDIQQDT